MPKLSFRTLAVLLLLLCANLSLAQNLDFQKLNPDSNAATPPESRPSPLWKPAPAPAPVLMTAAQAAGTFQKTLRGTFNETIHHAIPFAGGYLLAGRTATPGQGNTDALLVFVNNLGDVVWQQTFGGPGFDSFAELETSADGAGFYAIGETASTSGAGLSDAWVLRFDQNAGLLWQKTIGQASLKEAAHAAVSLSDGALVVSGSISNPNGGHVQTFIVQLGSGGNVLSTQRFASASESLIFHIQFVEGNLAYAGGGGNAAGLMSVHDLSQNGLRIAETEYDGFSTEALYYIHRLPDGNIIQADHTHSAFSGNGHWQWVQKITPAGDVLWSRVFQIPGQNALRGRIELAPDGGFFVVPGDASNSPTSDAYLLKLDSAGQVKWCNGFGGTDADRFFVAFPTADGGIFAAGQTVNPATGDTDVFYVKTDASGHVEGCCARPQTVVTEEFAPALRTTPDIIEPFEVPQPGTAQPGLAALESGSICTAAPMRKTTVALCPGEIFTLDGTAHTAPDTITKMVPAPGGCDSVLTWRLVPDAGAFVKTYGLAGRNEGGQSVVQAPDGNLYVTGSMAEDSAFILKIKPDGTPLWMFKFDVAPGLPDFISEIITDAEGMIAGCGISGADVASAGFAFRFDPTTRAMLWTRRFPEANLLAGLLEKSPGGNYLVYGNPHFPGGDNALLFEIDKTTGAPLIGRQYDLGTSEAWASIVRAGNKLFAVGRFTFAGAGFDGMRQSLTRLIPGGLPEWSRLSHVPGFQVARLYGNDLLVENGFIYSVFSGDDNGTSLDETDVFLQKTSLSGEIQWVKKFDLTAFGNEFAREIVATPDGFAILGRNLYGPGNLFILKTDKDGAFQWAKKFDFAFDDAFDGLALAQSQLLAVGESLYFTGTARDAAGGSDLILAKINADGTVPGGCTFLAATPVVFSAVQNPVSEAVSTVNTLTSLAGNEIQSPVSPGFFPGQNVCSGCPTTACFVEEELTVKFCPGDSVVLGGTVFTQSATVIDTALAQTPGLCDTIRTWFLEILPTASTTLTVQNCDGEPFFVGGTTISQPGTVVFHALSQNGCDSTTTYVLEWLPVAVSLDTFRFCPGDTVRIGNTNYTSAGAAFEVLTSPATGCDSFATHILELLPAPQTLDTLRFCPGGFVEIGGQVFTQPAIVTETIASVTGGCDTLVTHVLEFLPQPTRTQGIAFCPGQSVVIGGQIFNQSGIVVDTVAAQTGGCDTIVTYILNLRPNPTSTRSISFCPGETVNIGGQIFNQTGTVVDTIASTTGGCDTIATYHLTLLPNPTKTENRSFCAGQSVVIGGQIFNQTGTVVDTIASTTGGCDTIATYHLTLLPNPTKTENRSFCPGESVVIGGQIFSQTGTVVDTIASTTGGCDTIATYFLTLLPQPRRTVTLDFCPGDKFMIGGIFYDQPGTVFDTVPALVGCDTIVTYHIVLKTDGFVSQLSLTCPPNIAVEVEAGLPGMQLNYAAPVAATDCPCPDLALERTQGFASGSFFPNGTQTVCYRATDLCGSTKTCCFTVKVEELAACDIKNVGCLRFELLSIKRDAAQNWVYRIRMKNNCADPLLFAYLGVPGGQTALEPRQTAPYTSPAGRVYAVKNPNFSPVPSVRFKSVSDSISGGETDVFRYVLPQQVDADYLYVAARLKSGAFFEAHLNTFFCPVGVEPPHNRPALHAAENRSSENPGVYFYPNPVMAGGMLFANLSAWPSQTVRLKWFDSRGASVGENEVPGGSEAQAVDLPGGISPGLFFVELRGEKGERAVWKLVVE